MSRHNRTAVPGRPAPLAAPLPPPATRRVRPAGSAVARPDGAIAETSGSMDQLTPMQDEGLRDAAQASPNLSFHEGGVPVFTVVDENAEQVPPPQRYRVLEDKNIALNGHRFTMRADKEIDSSNYDIALLKRYGVKLQPVAAPASVEG